MGRLSDHLRRERNATLWWRVAGALVVAAGIAWWFSGEARVWSVAGVVVGGAMLAFAPTLGRWG